MKQNQVRQNLLTGEWVLYATERNKRPKNFSSEENNTVIPEYEPGCPFCPGNEDQLPETILVLPEEKPQTRTVFNKFPVIVPQEAKIQDSGFYRYGSAGGRHEVIIETPVHNRHPAIMHQDEVLNIIETYHARYNAITVNTDFLPPLIFRNHGKEAGTSLIHPHSQLIATNIISNSTINRQHNARLFFEKYNSCLLCSMIQNESEEKLRVINDNSFFLTIIPFFAEVSCEIWIIPKRHTYSFGEINPEEKKQLAKDLGKSLDVLFKKLNNPSYNYVIHSDLKSNGRFMHWYLQILPKLSVRAGYETGSGISVNTSLPEDDAIFLRNF